MQEGSNHFYINDFNFLPSLHVKFFHSPGLVDLIEDEEIDIWKNGLRPKIPDQGTYFDVNDFLGVSLDWTKLSQYFKVVMNVATKIDGNEWIHRTNFR